MLRVMVNGYGQKFFLIQKPQKINPKTHNFPGTQSVSSSVSYFLCTLPRASKKPFSPRCTLKKHPVPQRGEPWLRRGNCMLGFCALLHACSPVRLSTCQWLGLVQGCQGSYFRVQQIYDLDNFYPKHDLSKQAAKFVCVTLVS